MASRQSNLVSINTSRTIREGGASHVRTNSPHEHLLVRARQGLRIHFLVHNTTRQPMFFVENLRTGWGLPHELAYEDGTRAVVKHYPAVEYFNYCQRAWNVQIVGILDHRQEPSELNHCFFIHTVDPSQIATVESDWVSEVLERLAQIRGMQFESEYDQKIRKWYPIKPITKPSSDREHVQGVHRHCLPM